jgi:hypothetical protein
MGLLLPPQRSDELLEVQNQIPHHGHQHAYVIHWAGEQLVDEHRAMLIACQA